MEEDIVIETEDEMDGDPSLPDDHEDTVRLRVDTEDDIEIAPELPDEVIQVAPHANPRNIDRTETYSGDARATDKSSHTP